MYWQMKQKDSEKPPFQCLHKSHIYALGSNPNACDKKQATNRLSPRVRPEDYFIDG